LERSAASLSAKILRAMLYASGRASHNALDCRLADFASRCCCSLYLEETAYLLSKRTMRCILLSLLLLLAACGCGSPAPVGPPNLTADEEREILEGLNQVQSQEAQIPQPE
jgi:hypothetical protein